MSGHLDVRSNVTAARLNYIQKQCGEPNSAGAQANGETVTFAGTQCEPRGGFSHQFLDVE